MEGLFLELQVQPGPMATCEVNCASIRAKGSVPGLRLGQEGYAPLRTSVNYGF